MTTRLSIAGIFMWAALSGQVDVPRSRGPHKNIIEMRAMPPSLLLQGDGSAKQEACLTIALAFGIGGAPLVLHEDDGTTIASLLDRTFGQVFLMLKLRTDHVIEVWGTEEPQLRLVKACLSDYKTPS